MPYMVRMYPENGCQGSDNHHPHMMVCGDEDDDCSDDLGDGFGFMPYHELRCCIDGEAWPCKTKMNHDSKRHARAQALSERHAVEVKDD